MSIDYDKLRRELDEMEAGVHVTTRYNWADLAEELLRLHDELGDLRDTMHAYADRTNGESFLVAADYAHRIAQVLQGDTE